jgi:hypothetical protein
MVMVSAFILGFSFLGETTKPAPELNRGPAFIAVVAVLVSVLPMVLIP